MLKNFTPTGIIKDVVPTDVPDTAWTDGKNVRFDSGAVEKIKGDKDIIASGIGASVYFALSHRSAGSFLWSFYGKNKIFVANSTNVVDLSRFPDEYSTNEDRGWTGGNLKGVAIVTNGVDAPQKWVPEISVSTLYEDLLYDYSSDVSWADVGVTAGIMRPHGNYMIAMDITEGGYRNPRRTWWGHPPIDSQTEPPTWDYNKPQFDAGFFDMDDTDSPIIDGASMRDDFLVYKSDAVYKMTNVATNDIFTKKKIFSTFGALSRHCIQPFYGNHLVLTSDDIVLHDGTQVQSILTNKLNRYLSNTLDADYAHRSVMSINYPKKEIWTAIPTRGSQWPDLALIWSWVDGAITLRELTPCHTMASGQLIAGSQETFNTAQGAFDDDIGTFDEDIVRQQTNRLCLVTTKNRLVGVDIGETFAATGDMVSYIEKSGMAFGEIDSYKYITAIYPRIEAPPDSIIEIWIGVQSAIGAQVTTVKKNFVVGTHKVDCRVMGKLISFRFQTESPFSWRLQGFSVEYTLVGRNVR